MASSVQSSPRWTLQFDFIIYTNTLGDLKLSNLFILGFHVFPSLTFTSLQWGVWHAVEAPEWWLTGQERKAVAV